MLIILHSPSSHSLVFDISYQIIKFIATLPESTGFLCLMPFLVKICDGEWFNDVWIVNRFLNVAAGYCLTNPIEFCGFVNLKLPLKFVIRFELLFRDLWKKFRR